MDGPYLTFKLVAPMTLVSAAIDAANKLLVEPYLTLLPMKRVSDKLLVLVERDVLLRGGDLP